MLTSRGRWVVWLIIVAVLALAVGPIFYLYRVRKIAFLQACVSMRGNWVFHAAAETSEIESDRSRAGQRFRPTACPGG